MARPKKVVENHDEVKTEVEQTPVETHDEGKDVEKKSDEKKSDKKAVDEMADHPKFAKFK